MDTNNNWVIRKFNHGNSLTQSFLEQILCDSYEDAKIKIKKLKEENPLFYFEICQKNDSLIKPSILYDCSLCFNPTFENNGVYYLTEFEKYINNIAKNAHQNSINHGFWEDEPNEHKMAENIALIHSEASELLEAVRKFPHDAPSEHCPEISAQEEELADLFIRTCDYAAGFGFNLGKAILVKMEYNKNRPIKHGGKKF